MCQALKNQNLEQRLLLIEFERPRKGAEKTEGGEEKAGEQTREKRLVEGLVERLVEGLAENQRKMIDLIKKTPRVSKKELSVKIGISTTAVDKNIAQLKKRGFLRRVGPDKGGHWEILK